MQYLGYVSKALNDEVESLGGAAHAAQDEDLLAHQAPLLTHLEGFFQPIPLAAHQERHQLARCIVSVQFHLQNTCVAARQTLRGCMPLETCQEAHQLPWYTGCARSGLQREQTGICLRVSCCPAACLPSNPSTLMKVHIQQSMVQLNICSELERHMLMHASFDLC